MLNKVVITVHSFSPGTSQAFRDYCIRKKKNVLFIEHPLFGNPLSWGVGFIDTVLKVIRTGIKYDLFVGSNRLNALAGIILKKIGRVSKTVYFSPDWSKNRFNNIALNSFFQKLDYICVKNSDLIWNSSHIMKLDPMMKEREKLGYPKTWRNKQIQVPDGTDFFSIPPFNKINRYEISFVGHLKKEMGVQLAIKSLPLILKSIPKIKLLVIGSGPYENELRKKAEGLPVEFAGFMGDINKVYKKMSYSAIAIALYEETRENISQFSDPGKTKNYFSVGLPIIITKVPLIAEEIDKKKCGVAIRYNREEFTRAVIKLLKEDAVLKIYRRNVLELRKKYNWDTIFNRALRYTEKV